MTTTDLYAELERADALLRPHHTVEAVVYRTFLTALRGLLCLEAQNYKRLEKLEKAMALNTSNLDQNLASLNTDVDALIASHGTTETQAQAAIDNAASQVAAVDAKVKAATPAPTPAPPAAPPVPAEAPAAPVPQQ